jgi:hypothetical protein
LEEVICQTKSGVEEYVDMAALRAVYNRYVSKKPEPDQLWIWIVLILARWLRHSGLRA